MKTQKVLGIMSGTSMDGVDYCLCRVSGRGVKLVKSWSSKYPKSLRDRLLKAAGDEASSYELAQLDHDLGRFYAQKAPKVKVDYVGLHGQTVFHNPWGKTTATYQIGEPSYLAAKMKAPVVNQFRNMDMALGGQGAPMATAFHQVAFGDKKQVVAVQNLGGIANVTYLPKKGNLISFDTGPANILIDGAMERFTKGKLGYDKNGLWARQGVPQYLLVSEWLRYSYFAKKPPKSTGREEFNEKYLDKVLKQCKKAKLSQVDTIATLTAFTAESIAISYLRYLPQFPSKVVLCGGGALNPTLVKYIRRTLIDKQWLKDRKAPLLEVKTSSQLGWAPQSIEPAAFALLAYKTMNKLSGNIPETTGAKRAAIMGQIVPAP